MSGLVHPAFRVEVDALAVIRRLRHPVGAPMRWAPMTDSSWSFS